MPWSCLLLFLAALAAASPLPPGRPRLECNTSVAGVCEFSGFHIEDLAFQGVADRVATEGKFGYQLDPGSYSVALDPTGDALVLEFPLTWKAWNFTFDKTAALIWSFDLRTDTPVQLISVTVDARRTGKASDVILAAESCGGKICTHTYDYSQGVRTNALSFETTVFLAPASPYLTGLSQEDKTAVVDRVTIRIAKDSRPADVPEPSSIFQVLGGLVLIAPALARRR